MGVGGGIQGGETMSLNPSKGNMYDFVTHTWNTVKGACPHDCSYCYMKRWGTQKPVRFDAKELKTDLGDGNFIFVGSSCDMFANSIPHKWISETLLKCANNPQNSYLFQTKNPEMLAHFSDGFVRHSILCTTIETNRYYMDVMKDIPQPFERAFFFGRHLSAFQRFVTIEPIMDFDLELMVELIKTCNPEQVNIGADSGNNHLPEPPLEKVLELIDRLSGFTIVAKKRNLNRLTGAASE